MILNRFRLGLLAFVLGLGAVIAITPGVAQASNCTSGTVVDDYGNCTNGYAWEGTAHNTELTIQNNGTLYWVILHDHSGVNWYTVSTSRNGGECFTDGGSANGDNVYLEGCVGGTGDQNTDSSQWWGFYNQSPAHNCNVIKNRHTGLNMTTFAVAAGDVVYDAGGSLSAENCWQDVP